MDSELDNEEKIGKYSLTNKIDRESNSNNELQSISNQLENKANNIEKEICNKNDPSIKPKLKMVLDIEVNAAI